MDYKLDDEQQLILDSALRFANDELDFERRRKQVGAGLGLDRALWNKLAEMGWFGVGIAEDQGGFGGGAVETCLIAEALGRGQLLEPYVMAGVLPLRILSEAGSRPAELEAGIAGETIFALAHSEPQSRANLADVRLIARPDGGGWRLTGRKTLVAGALEADHILISARTSGGPQDEAGISLFLVDRARAGLRIEGDRLIDWSSGGDVVLDDLAVTTHDLVGPLDGAYALLRSGADVAMLALCAEAVGALQGSIDITAAYIAERKQFDVALSSFQALQHRMADMAIELVMARSALIGGLQALEIPVGDERAARLAGTKAIITGNLKWATAQGIQLHGGYGITEEYRVGHYYKRLLAIDAFFGRRAHQLAEYTRWSITRAA